MKIWIAVLWFACSSGQRPTTTSGSAAPSGSATAPAPLAKGCPATFASATGHCTMREGSCTYAEGECDCGAPPWCGGAAPPEPNPATFTWQCTPKVRPDGCPGSEPDGGGICTREGQTCDYTCSCSETARCVGGAWKVEHGPCKP